MNTRLALPLIAAVVVASSLWLSGSAAAHATVNGRCFNNHVERAWTLRWWAACTNLWGPHAFTERELRAQLGRPLRVSYFDNIKTLSYGRCVFGFNRRHQAIEAYCG
jgi:hypothetical protein